MIVIVHNQVDAKKKINLLFTNNPLKQQTLGACEKLSGCAFC